ncbi:MAG: ATP-binding cassette domain-containing protein [Bacteriovorax sp.]|nr:ATP-binding cassette domain-containing protein [Bacteriovorax sp.]
MFEIGPFEYAFKNNTKKVFSEKKITINEKELVLITGPSGSGKSTLLQMLKGIIPEYSSGEFTGQILYKGKSLSGEFFQQNLKDILFLFQNPFTQLIYPNVAEEFFFSMENFNYTREQMDQKKVELKSSFNLDAFWHKKTTELSHGECQRLVLASLLAIDPQVLLLDEPTAFLDPLARADFYNWLKKIKGSQTIIVVDHHLDEILPLTDNVIHVSRNGEITQSNPKLEKSEEIGKNVFFTPLALRNDSVQLTLSHIHFHYSDQERLLKDISLEASTGEILVLKGKNGKGKSTLFKIIAGIVKPLGGTVELKKNNQALSLKNHYKEIGFIFQNPESHFFYDTIAEELKAVANRDELKILLNFFFRDIDLSRSPFLLSEGEKRRLSILMTVFLNKSILLYDEPTFGQDQESISVIRELILQLKRMGKIQILISHDEKFIESLSTSVFELVDGSLRRLE